MPDLEQARNLVRTGKYTALKSLYDGVSNPLSELIRTALIPEEGHKFMVADFSAIEARVIAWFADEKWRLKVFEEGGDIYCASASQMFKVPVEKHGQNSHLRQKGKIAELALGYGGGINALKAFGADKMGMTEEEMQETVDLWRESSPKICELWKSLEKAAIRAVVRRGTCEASMGGVRFEYEKGILWMCLPSGRRIAYYGAQYGPSQRNPERKVLSYMGVEQQTRKWMRIETWGGKLTENLVQATARDCLRESMMALDEAGYDIRAHVHDEVIVSEPIDGRDVDQMATLMGQPIPWAPGLPLRADGYECNFYKKD
jgi:DNA polymerase